MHEYKIPNMPSSREVAIDGHAKYGNLIPSTRERPHSEYVTPMLNDQYQMSMTYTYWRTGRHEQHSVFDLFFRTPPFKGEFTVFAGLEEVLRFVQTFHFTESDIEFLKKTMPAAEPEFWTWLAQMDCSKILIYAQAEGTVIFPRVPVLRVEGPLAICQMLETVLLNLCNFASLMATNAARFRLAAGPKAVLFEFGLRRAQGPDGGMSASRYALVGGFNGTSNVQAAKESNTLPVGSHAHSMVSSFTGFDDLPASCRKVNGLDILEAAARIRAELGFKDASSGELAAFVSYAVSFPDRYIALVDTYDTLNSGVPNFIAVALALRQAGRQAFGIRLDSGDLAYLSKESRRMMRAADERYPIDEAHPPFPGCKPLAKCVIMASNDINEAVLLALNDQGHEINSFGIGTHLVTCQAQPALGMVYKLVEIDGSPRIKLSNDVNKVTLPGAKEAYRLLGSEGTPLMDYIIRSGESRPVAGKRLLVRHPFDERKRAYVTPSSVIPLLRLVWKGHSAKAPAVAQRASLERSAAAVAAAGTVSAASYGDAASGTAGHGASAGAGAGASRGANPADAGSAPPSPTAGSSSASAAPIPGVVEDDARSVHNPPGVNMRAPFPSMQQLQEFVRAQLALLREDHLRPLNPTPYKVSVSPDLFHFMHDLWMKEVPIPELE